MEKGGWLDQILGFALSALTNPWLAYTVAFVGGGVVAFLARRSPKRDWDFIKDGPGEVILGAFFLSAALRSVPRLVLPESRFVCDETTGPFGLPEKSNCRFVPEGEITTVVDYSFFDMMKDLAVGTAQEFVIGAVGAVLGVLIAMALPKPVAAAVGDPTTD